MPSRMQWLTFFRQWLKHPRSMASVAPSGRQLGRLMATALPRGAHHIVELGAGTGAITQALVRHGVLPQQLLAVEMNPVLHDVLARRFPRMHLAHGDACHLPELVAKSGAFACGEVDGVLSSLGLLSMPKKLQRDILTAAFAVLRPGGVFVQYTYGLRSPLDEDVCRQMDLRCMSAGFAWCNLPPARVFVYGRH
ncbi:class I SAM-dependent methyltransferase [Rhodanobacter hydrolyticus]|uniref:Methyltransferase domain-containing protein n=1 Tax=Rhodanobacter hydrolyticus TaxID=2250595 RepID=A0ABW8J9Q1_9GAMM